MAAHRRPTDAIASCQSRPLGAPPSADDFLPLLILVILQARPLYPFLNMQYISTFSHPDEMVGANGYMFTHFSSALTFIENMTASALHNCNQEEFDRCISVMTPQMTRIVSELPSQEDQWRVRRR